MKRYYIGLATTFHDPAIAIVGPAGEILFAEATERYVQSKRALNCDPFMRMPALLSEYCDADAEFILATTWSQPFTLLLTAASVAGFFSLRRLRSVGSQVNRTLLEDDDELAYGSFLHCMQTSAGLGVLIGVQEAFGHSRVSIRRFPHHLTHAAHACYTSPFSEAVCLVADGMGELGSMALFRYEDGLLHTLWRHWGRESLGFLYGLITDLCGYDYRLGEEWKVMGLAPHGEFDPELYDLFRRIYRVERGMLRFASRSVIRETVAELRKHARKPDSSPLKAGNMAFVGQQVFSEIMLSILTHLDRAGISKNLALAGGCALNSSFNGTVLSQTHFTQLYVPCAPGDDGNAVGAALLAYRQDHPYQHTPRPFQTPYLGSAVSAEALGRIARFCGSSRTCHMPGEIHRRAAQLLAEGKLLGWIQGRAEFGPRALGNRSILADPRRHDIKDLINTRVKFRESFRPFAPSILHEHGPAFLEHYQESPYMERTLHFRKDAAGRVPGVVHVDGTGRLQTVKREWNSRFHDLISAFYEITGVPLVLNTSFNIMGRPIVHSVEDVVGVFYTAGLDALVVEDYLVEK